MRKEEGGGGEGTKEGEGRGKRGEKQKREEGRKEEGKEGRKKNQVRLCFLFLVPLKSSLSSKHP